MPRMGRPLDIWQKHRALMPAMAARMLRRVSFLPFISSFSARPRKKLMSCSMSLSSSCFPDRPMKACRQ
eukprot:1261786-Lingulodinium_polyedra.AAC.1